ncbi:VOC family protein [Acrocarpospora catenulata]|uniref:VOC family protein n=1 Tax=Acrocarpospora catenulata TaxID=2836182 RepID=UPI001BD9996F|nr:VOC family protein [Acrocarpospora catenulata]
MAEFTSHPAGSPCWVDLSSTDVASSVDFYSRLFGWQAEFDDRPETGGYGQFYRNGKSVAGIGPTQGAGRPTTWNTYFATDDAGKVTESVREADGTVVAEPMEIMGEGIMAAFQDPTGGYFGVWQPERHIGAQLANEPGTFTWCELATRDPEAAKVFYGRVFGWAVDSQLLAGGSYSTWLSGGRQVGGMMPMSEQFPPEMPAHWLVYFGTANLDMTLAQAEGLGAMVRYGPRAIDDLGRFAVLTDPHGALFALWEAKSDTR